MQKKYVIIGTSAAGIAAARTLRNLDQDARIICYSDEPESPYNKCFLADFVHQQKTEEQVCTLTLEQAAALNIQLCLGVRVTALASDNKKLMLSTGESVPYDAVLIATGTRPIVPPIDGIDRYGNVFAFHNMRDAHALNDFILVKKPRRAIVIGAGLSGLEVADALCARNIQVTVVESGSQLLARHVPVKGSALIESMMKAHGVRVLTATHVVAISGEESVASAVMLSEGTVLPTDLVVFAVGLRQNSEIAREAGILMVSEGISVDASMQTSQTDVYAAGDVIAVYDHLSGTMTASCTWPDAMQQGMHVAYAMAGKPKAYQGASIIATSAFFGLKFFACGPRSGLEVGYEVVERADDTYYHRYVLAQGILKGFCLIGNTQRYHVLRRAMLLKEPFSL
jgi:NAD(P)H-nitrite reductase large subunit